MKRKADTEQLPSTKKAKLNPEHTVLRLLKEYGNNVSKAFLQNEISKLSLGLCHEILQELKDNKELDLPGASLLIRELFLHLFTRDYRDSEPSLIDLCNLLYEYKYCQKLPLFNGEIYNKWLKNFNLSIPSNFENFHHILRVLGKLASSEFVDYFAIADFIDLDLINKYLLKVIENRDNIANLAELRSSIISALDCLTESMHFKGRLNKVFMEKLLTIDPQERPNAQAMETILRSLGSLIKRGVFSNIPSTALIEQYLLYILSNAPVDSCSKIFCELVPQLATQKHYKQEPFKAEVMQQLINHFIHSQIKSWQLANVFLQLGRLIRINLTQGNIDGFEEILYKIEQNELNSDMIGKIFLGLVGMVSHLKNPLKTQLIQKFMVEKLRGDIASLSILYDAIYSLASQSKLSGVFDEVFFEHVKYCANSQAPYLDSKLVKNLFCAIGICLSNGHIDFFLHSELLEKLLEHFSQMNPDPRHIIDVCIAIQKIETSKKFKGSVPCRIFDEFLNILLKNNEYNKLLTCLYTLGMVARKGHLAGTISQKSALFPLNTLWKTNPVKPINVWKIFTAIADLRTKNALDIDDKYLEEMICEIVLNIDSNDFEYYLDVQASDIVQILQLPEALSGKILQTLLPLLLHLLNLKPNTTVVDQVFDNIKKLAKSKHLPKMSAEHIEDLFAVFLKTNSIYPHSVLKAFSTIVDLADLELLNGSLDLNLLKLPLLELCDEQLDAQRQMDIDLSDIATLLNEIDCLESYIQLQGEMDILSRVMQLIAHKVYQSQIADISAIAEIFGSLAVLVENEIITEAIKGYDVMEVILEVVLSLPALKKEQIIPILNGLCCLREYKLYKGSINAELILSLGQKLQSLDANEFSKIYPEKLSFLLEDEKLYVKSEEFRLSSPSQSLRALFFKPLKLADEQNFESLGASLNSKK